MTDTQDRSRSVKQGWTWPSNLGSDVAGMCKESVQENMELGTRKLKSKMEEWKNKIKYDQERSVHPTHHNYQIHHLDSTQQTQS